MTQQQRDSIKERVRHTIAQSPDRRLFRKVLLFGSYAYGEPRADSDVDLLVDFDRIEPIGLFKLAQLQRELEEGIGKPVDLVTIEGLNKYIRDEVIRRAQPVYEK